jgi:exodeoxyribonuclease V
MESAARRVPSTERVRRIYPSSISWSPQQDEALRSIRRWFRQRDKQVFLLFGYAGTGKTTLARALREDVQTIHYATFTGKAAHVLHQRGCGPVSTIHKLIYDTHFDEVTGRFVHELKDEDALCDIDLIVIDEASMVDERLATQLLSFGRMLLIIGDPAQLPPVSDYYGNGYFMSGKPDVMLTEIHRQAADNPILFLADHIRRNGALPHVGYTAGEALCVTNDEGDVLDHDILLVGLNDTRHSRNRSLRRQLGFTRTMQNSHILPKAGETLVCLRNDYATEPEPVLNGALFKVEAVMLDDDDKLPIVELELSSRFNGESRVRVPTICFTDGDTTFHRGLQVFDFGYALTVHKSQGSEWNSVMVINESRYFRDQARRWLYTAVTRARKRLTIVDYS